MRVGASAVELYVLHLSFHSLELPSTPTGVRLEEPWIYLGARGKCGYVGVLITPVFKSALQHPLRECAGHAVIAFPHTST